MEEKISVIIPVYNVAEYVAECIESVINQTYSNLEIIIVDDGSSDGSADICRKYADKDERIRVITQPNMGVAKARKVAAQQAKGKYMAFVDADDYLEIDFYKQMMEAREDYDVVMSGFFRGYDNRVKCFDVIQEGEYSNSEEYEFLIKNMIVYQKGLERGVTPYIWNKLFKTEIAQEVFEEVSEDIYLGEDSDFLYRYILKGKTARITKVCGYHYRVREKSAVHSGDSRYLLNLHFLYNSLNREFEKHLYKEALLLQLQIWMARMINGIPQMLGFYEEVRNIKYFFPFLNEMKGKKVVLYGAGVVGKDYHALIKDRKECEIVLWVDKNWEDSKKKGYNVAPISQILEKEYDVIIIAIQDEQAANRIKSDLRSLGIEETKILWRKAIDTVVVDSL